MTRGTLFYYESDDKVYSSIEYNGGMYHGTAKKHEGIGAEVIKLMSNLKSVEDFKSVLKTINKNFNYKEGNDCYAIDEKTITKGIKDTIKWIDDERKDLKGSDLDPRTWKSTPTFKDVKTWRFWGIPNLSDYSYIYNNSGNDLTMMLNGEESEMVIPNGALGILNFGRSDCIYMNNRIVK